MRCFLNSLRIWGVLAHGQVYRVAARQVTVVNIIVSVELTAQLLHSVSFFFLEFVVSLHGCVIIKFLDDADGDRFVDRVYNSVDALRQLLSFLLNQFSSGFSIFCHLNAFFF